MFLSMHTFCLHVIFYTIVFSSDNRTNNRKENNSILFQNIQTIQTRCNEQDEDTVAVNYNEQNRLYVLKEGEDKLPTPVRAKTLSSNAIRYCRLAI